MKNQWNPKADLVITNAKIYTVALTIEEIKAGKTEFPILQRGYVAAKDGRTIAVGERPDDCLIGEHTSVIDAGGMTLAPGFIDSHMHAIGAGTDLLDVNLEKASSKGEMLSAIGERAATTEKGRWIKASGWNELVWEDKETPTRRDLDSVTEGHPVVCVRACHHVYAVNSKALAMAGIAKDAPNPDGGIIGRYEDGEPNGLLYENSAMDLIHRVMPPVDESKLVDAIKAIGAVINSFGITSCIDANLRPGMIRAYHKAHALGALSYRSRMMFYLDQARGDAAYQLKKIEETPAVTGFGNDMLKFNGLKITLDGVPATGTAYMRKPYEHMPETGGRTTFSQEDVYQMVDYASSLGWQVGIHCCGDKAADIAIGAYISAYNKAREDLRHYIIHHSVVQPDQFPLLKEYGVPVASQPTIALLLGEQNLIGEEMAGRYMYGKSYFDYGVILGGSSDFPVSPCSPLQGMYAAVTRLGADGRVWNEQEKLTPAQALIMWTKNSAYFSHDDKRAGSVEVGNYADYVLLDAPILEVSPERIRDAKVLYTIVDGKVVFRDNGAD